MDRRLVATAVGLIALSTLVIASSMLGAIAIVTGQAVGFAGRVPFYVLGTAAVFTAVVVVLEMRIDDGFTILTTGLAVAGVALLAIGLGSEGLRYVVMAQRLQVTDLVYLLAAGLISTGVIFWAVRHWREFASTTEIV